MVRIRLRRVGAKRQPSYRVVVADRESPRDGRFLEVIGHYNPRAEPATIKIDEDRLYHWLKRGAQPSDSVLSLLRTTRAWERWERLKQGESVEKLLEEAKAADQAEASRTRMDEAVPKPARRKPKSKSKKAETVEAESGPVEEESEVGVGPAEASATSGTESEPVELSESAQIEGGPAEADAQAEAEVASAEAGEPVEETSPSE